MLSSYFLELRTGQDYASDAYDAAAQRMVNMLVSLLSDSQTINALTHDATRESCHSDVEVMLEFNGTVRELVGKVVVDIRADAACKFDKSKWTKLVKARPEADEWKLLKISKRAVPEV